MKASLKKGLLLQADDTFARGTALRAPQPRWSHTSTSGERRSLCCEIPVLGVRAVPQKVTVTLPSSTDQCSHQHCQLVCWWETRLLSSHWCCHREGRFAHPYDQQHLHMEAVLRFLSLIYTFCKLEQSEGTRPLGHNFNTWGFAVVK